jgi:hypothetical protein
MTFVDREQMRRARGKGLTLSKRTSSFSIERNPTSELTGLPPVNETIVVPNTFDERLAGGNSGPTICSTASLQMSVTKSRSSVVLLSSGHFPSEASNIPRLRNRRRNSPTNIRAPRPGSVKTNSRQQNDLWAVRVPPTKFLHRFASCEPVRRTKLVTKHAPAARVQRFGPRT